MTDAVLESIEQERGYTVLDADLPTMAGQIRRRFFRRQSLTSAEAINLWGPKARANLTATITDMKYLGYRFSKEKQADKTIVYRLENPEHRPTEADVTNLRENRNTGSRGKKTRQERSLGQKRAGLPLSLGQKRAQLSRPTPVKRPKRAPMPVVPTLGETLEVYSAELSDDGVVRLGLRLNGTRWKCEVIEQTLIPITEVR